MLSFTRHCLLEVKTEEITYVLRVLSKVNCIVPPVSHFFFLHHGAYGALPVIGSTPQTAGNEGLENQSQFAGISLPYFKLSLRSILFSKECLEAGLWQQIPRGEATQLTRDKTPQNTRQQGFWAG